MATTSDDIVPRLNVTPVAGPAEAPAGANAALAPENPKSAWLSPEIFKFFSSFYLFFFGEPGDRPWFNVLLWAVPVAIVGYGLNWSPGANFVLAIIAMIPLAERLGFVTESVADHTNDTIGGLLNATCGNVPELIVAVIALAQGLLRVVQLSLLGSVLSNLLLVLGSAFFLGGLKHQKQLFNQNQTHLGSGMLLVTSVALVFPAVLVSGNTELYTGSSGLLLSRITSVIMLIIYGSFLFFQLKTHAHLFEEDEEGGELEAGSLKEGGADSDTDPHHLHHHRDRTSSVLEHSSPVDQVTRNGLENQGPSGEPPSQAQALVSEDRPAVVTPARPPLHPNTETGGVSPPPASAVPRRGVLKKPASAMQLSEATRSSRADSGADAQVVETADDLSICVSSPPQDATRARSVSQPGRAPTVDGRAVSAEAPKTAAHRSARKSSVAVISSRGSAAGTASLFTRPPQRRSYAGSLPLHGSGSMTPSQAAAARLDIEDTIPGLIRHRHSSGDGEEPPLGLKTSIFWMMLVTAFIAVLSESLVSSIEGAAVSAGIPDTFLSTIVLPVAGNAAEHASALIFAMKNRLDVSIGVAVGSATQISLFLIPLLVVIGWCIGKPLSLNYQLLESAMFVLAVLLVNALIVRGSSHWLLGLLLVGTYIITAVTFLLHQNVIIDK